MRCLFRIGRLISVHLTAHRGDLTYDCLIDAGPNSPVQPPVWKVQQKIPHSCSTRQTLQNRFQFRAHARKTVEVRKEWKESFIPHGPGTEDVHAPCTIIGFHTRPDAYMKTLEQEPAYHGHAPQETSIPGLAPWIS